MINIGSKKRKTDERPKKEGFMQGVIALMFSQVLIKILGLVYTLYLTNRQGFGDKGNGICASGYQIYALLLTISSIGVPSAISKLVSERVAVGDNKGAHRIFKICNICSNRINWKFIIIFWSKCNSKSMVTNTRCRNDISSTITSNILCYSSISYERIL